MTNKFLSKVFPLFLSFILCLPHSSFAMRASAVSEAKETISGLEERLSSITTGLEEASWWRQMAFFDPEMFELLVEELDRLVWQITAIASETYTDPRILIPLSHPIVQKYAEGIPFSRFYQGSTFVDLMEDLVQRRWVELVKTHYHPQEGWPETIEEAYGVSVQPNAGSTANQIAFFVAADTGDVVEGLELSSGGHLTHGFKLNVSGTHYKSVQFKVDPKTGEIDYNSVENLALENHPRLIIVGGTAVIRKIDWTRLRKIADKAGAFLVADMAHNFAQMLGENYPSPFGLADFITLTNHKNAGPRSAVIYARRKVDRELNKRKGIDPVKQKERYETTTLFDWVNSAVTPGLQGGPKENEIAAKGVHVRWLQSKDGEQYTHAIGPNSKALAAALQRRGATLVGGDNPTDTHLMLWDVRPYGLTGTQAANALESAGLVTNSNTIPLGSQEDVPSHSKQTPRKPFGVRIGVNAMTWRGMREKEMDEVADLFVRTLQATNSETGKVSPEVRAEVERRVRALTDRFPIYADFQKMFHQIREGVQFKKALNEQGDVKYPTVSVSRLTRFGSIGRFPVTTPSSLLESLQLNKRGLSTIGFVAEGEIHYIPPSYFQEEPIQATTRLLGLIASGKFGPSIEVQQVYSTATGPMALLFLQSSQTGLEETVNIKLERLFKNISSNQILVINSSVIKDEKKGWLEALIQQVPPDFKNRILLFGEDFEVQQLADNYAIPIVPSDDVNALAMKLEQRAEQRSFQVHFLGDPLTVKTLLSLLPSHIQIISIPLDVNLRELFLTLGVPQLVLDQVKPEELESILTQERSA